MSGHHGSPCWYELTSADQAASQAFYGPVMGWSFHDAGMEGFAYTLAMAGDQMVAGLMTPDAPMPDFWMVYFAVDDCDAACARVFDLGGAVHRPPEDIPGTGRFAIAADRQGAVFGLLQPLDGQTGAAFDQMKTGHGAWHELMSPDPAAAFSFYAALLGWAKGDAMPMGDMGTYQLVRWQGTDIGGLCLPEPGAPAHWLPYFSVAGIDGAIARIRENGGTILQDRMDVPGGVFIAIARDPQGAHVAVIGPA